MSYLYSATPQDLIGNVKFLPLPDGSVPMEAIVWVKCMDRNGHTAWSFRYSEGLDDIEKMGVVATQYAFAQRQLVDKTLEVRDDPNAGQPPHGS